MSHILSTSLSSMCCSTEFPLRVGLVHSYVVNASCRGGGRYLRLGGAPTIDNTVQPYYLCTDGKGGASTQLHSKYIMCH